MEELKELVKKFESSFNYYILSNNYGTFRGSKEFIDNYLAILNHMYDSDETKYSKLTELLKESNNVTLETVRSITSINDYWKPDFDSIKKDTEYYKADISKRSKTVCEAIQYIFENPDIRKNITNIDLYNLYGSYYQISKLIKNKILTEEILNDIEAKLRPISDRIWSSSITNPEDFKPGQPFKFIVHNISKTDMETTNINEHFARKGRISASLITDKEMGVYGANKYGFIYPNDSKIITSGYTDLYSYETQNEGNFYQNSNNSVLIPPQAIENYSVNLSIKENGKILNNDNANIYNEVLLDATNGLKPIGIYCITFGEKELSYDYVSAKKLAQNTGLPFIDIDISLYRTKNNQGTYLIDEEPLTKKEQEKFAEKFLKQYYKHKGYNLETIQNFTEFDLKLYQDMIIDLFLTQKENGNIKPEELFENYEKLKQNRKEKATNFNTYINEIADLKESLNNFNEALSICDNEAIKESIINQSNEIITRINMLNKLIENTNSIGLSDNNFIYQNNIISKKVMGDFTPFNIETLEFNGQKISVITGYKTNQELKQIKEEKLKQIDLENEPIEKRKEHAKRVIELKFNGYETNSVNIDIESYKQTNLELETLKNNSQSFIEIASFDKEIKNYEQLEEYKNQLLIQIQTLSDNRKIYAGVSSIDWLEQNQKELTNKIQEYKNSISLKEQELITLLKNKDDALNEKEELDKKGFLSKVFASKKINQNRNDLLKLKSQIEILEKDIENIKNSIKFEENYLKNITESFLSSFALENMSLEEYKERLQNIDQNPEELTSVFTQKELEDKLNEIEIKLKELDKEKIGQMKQALIQKKIQVGILSPEQIIENNIEIENEKVTGIGM